MPSAEGSNIRAHRMRPPKDNQPALAQLLPAVETLFTNLETFVTSFFLYLVIKIEGGLLLFLKKKKKYFLLLPLYALPHFSVPGEVGGKEFLKNLEGGNFY